MNRRQAKILIKAIAEDKEIVLPRTHYHIRHLTEEGYLEEVTHEIPSDDGTQNTRNKIGTLMKWIMSGAVSTCVIDDKAHIVLHKPTNLARQWLDEKARSRRNKDKRLLREAGYYDA